MKRTVVRFVRSLLWIFLLTALDQGTKLWAFRCLKEKDDRILIPKILRLHYLWPENRGIAFGLFQGSVLFFGIMSLVLFAALLVFLFRIPGPSRYLPLRTGCILIAAGAAGNLIDRLGRSYVIDFIWFELIDFPLFNLADVFVVCGAVFFAVLCLFFYREEDFSFLRRRV